MPLQGIILIAKASGEVNVDEAAAGCQIAGDFGVDFPFNIKDDRAAVPIDNLAEFRRGFAAAGGAEFDHVAKLPAFPRWLDGVYLPILPFSDVQKFPLKRRDFKVVELMRIG